MGLQYDNLDDLTREYMVAEAQDDIKANQLYRSKYFTDEGAERYPTILIEHLKTGTDDTLAEALADGFFASHTPRTNKSGTTTMAKVPVTAPITLAEGEFNRFYLRGLCAALVAEGGGSVEVYRARPSANPRPESTAKVGRRLDAQALLDDLRGSNSVDTALGLPPGPNSGISGRR